MTEYEKGYKQGRQDEAEMLVSLIRAIHDHVYNSGYIQGYKDGQENVCFDDGK